MISSAKLRAADRVTHGFFGRDGGSSLGDFYSLNCSRFVGDSDFNVAKNLSDVSQHLSAKKIITLQQTHSNECICIDDSSMDDSLIGDALVTKNLDIAIGVLTADCAPILFFDTNNNIIGAAHAGWRGARNGIIDATIKCMLRVGAELQNIIAAIGPCIAQNSYNVNCDFIGNFTNADLHFRVKHNKIYFDLPGYCKDKLMALGIYENNIETLHCDTFANPNTYFSYRFAMKNSNGICGRQISAICLHA